LTKIVLKKQGVSDFKQSTRIKILTDNQEFICIYCKKRIPEVRPTKSDIIPTFLGGTLVLNNAVCKVCNNKINSEIEQPIRDAFSYLRSGLDLGGRRNRDVKVQSKVKILGKELKMSLGDSGIELPPFKYRNPDGKSVIVIVGEKEYVKKKIKEVEFNSTKSWSWNDFEDEPKPEILIEALPFDILIEEKGQRFAAKIAFERLCQIRAPSILTEWYYDNIRAFIIDSEDNVFSNLFFNTKIMKHNFDISFPYHAIFLIQRDHKLIAIVSLFGLFYFLIVLADRMPIIANWEDCVLIHPQSAKDILPIIRGSLFPMIPISAFVVDNNTYDKAKNYAIDKLKKALKQYKTITVIGMSDEKKEVF
jgi:hypothetical protein